MLASKSIIKREEEFLKLNAEIDLQTKNLMTQVDFIKEIHSNTNNLYSNWEKTGVTLLGESKDNEEHQYDIATLFEDSYSLKDSIVHTETKVGNEISLDNETLEKVNKKEMGALDAKKDKIKRHSTLSHSAKPSSYTMNTTILGQDIFPLPGLTRHKSDVKLKQGLDSEVLPESLKGIGQEGMTRFLTAKVKLLTEQVATLQKDEKQHIEKIKELQSARDKLTEEKEKLIQQANTTKNLLVKCEQQANNIALQLQTTQAENGHLKKELEILKKEVRQSNQNCNANELKLNRALEEVEKLKGTLQQLKQDEKELKEFHRRKTEDLSSTVKRLDKQRVELLNGFKKQLLVINNLKRQKGLSEACKLLKCAEEDFNNFLECNPRSMVNRADFVKNDGECWSDQISKGGQLNEIIPAVWPDFQKLSLSTTRLIMQFMDSKWSGLRNYWWNVQRTSQEEECEENKSETRTEKRSKNDKRTKYGRKNSRKKPTGIIWRRWMKQQGWKNQSPGYSIFAMKWFIDKGPLGHNDTRSKVASKKQSKI